MGVIGVLSRDFESRSQSLIRQIANHESAGYMRTLPYF